MPDMHYGVVLIEGRWTIIGDGLHYGSYVHRHHAERAARRLAEHSAGLSVQLHVQEDDGRLRKDALIN